MIRVRGTTTEALGFRVAEECYKRAGNACRRGEVMADRGTVEKGESASAILSHFPEPRVAPPSRGRRE